MVKSKNPDTEILLSILQNKALKIKEKTVRLSSLLLTATVSIDKFIGIAKKSDHVTKGILIEAIEHASKTKPEIVNTKTFEFTIESLIDDAPKVKLESARVIANTVHL